MSRLLSSQCGAASFFSILSTDAITALERWNIGRADINLRRVWWGRVIFRGRKLASLIPIDIWLGQAAVVRNQHGRFPPSDVVLSRKERTSPPLFLVPVAKCVVCGLASDEIETDPAWGLVINKSDSSFDITSKVSEGKSHFFYNCLTFQKRSLCSACTADAGTNTEPRRLPKWYFWAAEVYQSMCMHVRYPWLRWDREMSMILTCESTATP